MTLCAAQGLRIGLHAPLANEAVGVQTAVKGDDLDGETLLGQQRDRLLRRIAAGGVGIEVHHHLRGVTLEDRYLLLSKGRAAGGDYVVNAAQVDRDAVHLALDEQGKLMLADGGLGLVQVEEHQALGIKRRLRRVDVLRARLLTRLQRPCRKGDHAAALVGDGKHHALAEAIVDVSQRPISLLLGAEQPRCPQRLFIGHSAEPVAQGVEAVRRVADPELHDTLNRKAATCKVLACHGSFRPTQLLFEPSGRGLVQIEELGPQACSGCFFRRGKLPLG